MQLMHSLTNKATTPKCVGVGVLGGGGAVRFVAHNFTMNNKLTATPLTVSVIGHHLQ